MNIYREYKYRKYIGPRASIYRTTIWVRSSARYSDSSELLRVLSRLPIASHDQRKFTILNLRVGVRKTCKCKPSTNVNNLNPKLTPTMVVI